MKTRILTGIVFFVVLLLFASNIQAMSSTNYRMDWVMPLTGGGGGPMSSTNYQVNMTIGQKVVGPVSSDHFRVGLGYWYGTLLGGPVYMPLIVK